MAPPELARDAPGLDVAHPLEIGVLPLWRHEAGAPVLDRADRLFGQRLGVGVPLVAQHRLDRGLRALAVGHAVPDFFDFLDQARGLEVREHALARDEPVEAAIGFRHLVVEPALGIEDADHLEAVAAADLEVVEVVAGRDLDRARALLRVGIGVGDDRQAAADERQDRVPADQPLVARIVGMDRDRGVAEHGLGPRGRDRDVVARSGPRSDSGCTRAGPRPRSPRPRGRRPRSAAGSPS